MKATLAIAGLLLVALPVGASGKGGSARNHAVALKNVSIKPKTLRIRRGDRVTWTWGDSAIDAQHNVTSMGPARFKSAGSKLSGTYTVRFSKAGTYNYECTIHPLAMEGKIIVR
ncbi:MAG: cupredoxin family copper-binding protein [Solirubrobacteraceae bacterium]